jgi:hypothetical protein
MRGAAVCALAAALGCGAGAADGPPVYAVTVPAPGNEPREPTAPKHADVGPPACPPGSSREGADCVVLVPSPEIPAWKPPQGHLDPCATFTSEKGLVDCDPDNEHPPPERDAGTPSRRGGAVR